MKHILILEDEQRNANRLVRLLKEIVPEARIDGPLVTIEAAAEFLRKAPASDLILADIRLSDGLSFEALKQTNSPQRSRRSDAAAATHRTNPCASSSRPCNRAVAATASGSCCRTATATRPFR